MDVRVKIRETRELRLPGTSRLFARLKRRRLRALHMAAESFARTIKTSIDKDSKTWLPMLLEAGEKISLNNFEADDNMLTVFFETSIVMFMLQIDGKARFDELWDQAEEDLFLGSVYAGEMTEYAESVFRKAVGNTTFTAEEDEPFGNERLLTLKIDAASRLGLC